MALKIMGCDKIFADVIVNILQTIFGTQFNFIEQKKPTQMWQVAKQ